MSKTSYPVMSVNLTLEQAYSHAHKLGYKHFWHKGGLYPMGAIQPDTTKALEGPIVGWQFMPGSD